MEMPRPGPAHALLQRLVGDWSGPEQLAPSPWGPGGAAMGHFRCREALGGMAFVQDYREEKDGEIVFEGHGVMVVEPGRDTVLWWWFDTIGFPPDPSVGHWDGDTLHFEKRTPRGSARYRYEFSGNDRYRFVIENRLGDAAEFTEFMRGDYVRAPALRASS
jgi:hypothetical protein